MVIETRWRVENTSYFNRKKCEWHKGLPTETDFKEKIKDDEWCFCSCEWIIRTCEVIVDDNGEIIAKGKEYACCCWEDFINCWDFLVFDFD